ncbi:hypothetical protein ACO22_06436 [Paracoccidioides brasiliensis]|uniref:Uncharacterized protein n=1 Tax=Paracoccidioides brasiliensis TaxID=121759 RepID=A0A1D2J7H5_PARBR|nr:hypothetical protein ACO22_06436 [Paracoccidioides brasiliensis]
MPSYKEAVEKTGKRISSSHSDKVVASASLQLHLHRRHTGSEWHCITPLRVAHDLYGALLSPRSCLPRTQQSFGRSEIFSGSPYNFNMSNVGNTNFSSFICGVLGMLWDGYASDWCILFLSRRNKGILEPEFKFWTMLVPALINTGRLLMHGLGVFNGVMWFLPVGFGMDSVAFGIGSGGAIAIAITYAVYCYPHIASDSLVLMLLIRNKIGCGFAFTSQ